MKKGKEVGYEAFACWEREMAAKKAGRLVGKLGITREDAKDIEQDLLIQILVKRRRYNPHHESNLSRQKFMSYVLDKAIANTLQARKQDKRAVHINPRSLDEDILQEDGDVLRFGDLLDDEHSLSRMGRPSRPTEEEMRIDVERVLSILSPSEIEIVSLIMRGYKPSEIGRMLGKARATLDRQIAKMRMILYDAGLKDYL